MINRLLLIFTILFSLTTAVAGVFAAEPSGDMRFVGKGGGKEVCSLIKDNLQRGVDAKAVTKINIQLGSDACHVVKCAIDGGGELRLIIAGAVEAGATPDVVSRCCIDAGAQPAKVAEVLEGMGEGLGYSPPGDQFVPMDTRTAGTTTGTRFVSPSSF